MTGKPAYYNEFDPYPAQWLRNLIAAGHLPAGDVDERDIREISGDDLEAYGQCHFFAGIGGWPLALALAGWPGDRPVWTGSCPCQPLSGAGQRKGHADERHLWPAFYQLIAERRPATVFGEQVASKDGREWLAGVRADLEHLGYAVGAADLPAAGVGAPHIRQRLWWVADAGCRSIRDERCEVAETARRDQGEEDQRQRLWSDTGHGGAIGGQHGQQPQNGRSDRLEHAEGDGRLERRAEPGGRGASGGCGAGRLGDTGTARLSPCERETVERTGRRQEGRTTVQSSSAPSFWSNFDPIPCADGKARRVEPGTFPLAHGIPARVGKLRAYGNAIVPQVAAEFIEAVMGARP